MKRQHLLDGAILCVALVPAYYVLKMVFYALNFPMELEIREGVTWIHVLAEREGINIYDHTQVAFQGSWPADHLFKTMLSFLAPGLPSQINTRMFVGLLPFALLWMSWEALGGIMRWRLAAAIGAACAIYVGMINLREYNMLVGRADPAALFFVTVQAALTARFYFAGPPKLWLQILHVVAMALGFFTVWRMAPVLGGLWVVAQLTLLFRYPKIARRFLILSPIVFVSVFLFFLFFSFKGDPSLFYVHFVGLFIPMYKLDAVKPWEIFPSELLNNPYARSGILPLLVLMGASAVYAVRAKRAVLLTLSAMALFCYVFLSFGYSQNKAGGGLHYFSPLLVIGALTVLWAASESKGTRTRLGALLLLAVYVAAAPHWRQVAQQTDNLSQNAGPVGQFRQQLQLLDERGEIMSETYHLFKKKLGKTRIDTADNVYEMTRLNVFEPAFVETMNKFLTEIQSGIYPYFLSGGIESPPTGEYLKKAYKPLGMGPGYDTMNAPGGCLSVINCPLIWQKVGP
jgi:hypothetical protein